jgi:hypothetical protein
MGQIYTNYKERRVILEGYINKNECIAEGNKCEFSNSHDIYPAATTLYYDFIEEIGIEQTSLTASECAKELEDILIKHSNNPKECDLFVKCSSKYGMKICQVYNLSKIMDKSLFNSIWYKLQTSNHYHLDSEAVHKLWPNNKNTVVSNNIKQLSPIVMSDILEKKLATKMVDAEYDDNRIPYVNCYEQSRCIECDLYVLPRHIAKEIFKESQVPKVQQSEVKTPELKTQGATETILNKNSSCKSIISILFPSIFPE